MPSIIRAHHDVVHIARKSCHHHQRDVHHEKSKETEHGEEMDGSSGLPAPEDLGVPGKAVYHRR